MPLRSTHRLIQRTTDVASGVPHRPANHGAVATAIPVMTTLIRIEIVVTVGAISSGSSGHRTMARLTPSSLKLSRASSATTATAKVPNSSGPSRRASTMPTGSVPSRARTVLPRLQTKALPADGAAVRCAWWPISVPPPRVRWVVAEAADVSSGRPRPRSSSSSSRIRSGNHLPSRRCSGRCCPQAPSGDRWSAGC